MKIEDEHLDDRDRELFVGHIITWGAIVMAIVLAIGLNHFSSAEKDKSASRAHAEAAS